MVLFMKKIVIFSLMFILVTGGISASTYAATTHQDKCSQNFTNNYTKTYANGNVEFE